MVFIDKANHIVKEVQWASHPGASFPTSSVSSNRWLNCSVGLSPNRWNGTLQRGIVPPKFDLVRLTMYSWDWSFYCRCILSARGWIMTSSKCHFSLCPIIWHALFWPVGQFDGLVIINSSTIESSMCIVHGRFVRPQTDTYLIKPHVSPQIDGITAETIAELKR